MNNKSHEKGKNLLLRIKNLWFLPMITLLVIACGKEEIVRPELDDGVSVVIRDLAGDIEASMAEGVEGKDKRPFNIFLYRFKDQRQIWIKNRADSIKYLKTKDWDIAFTGPYNSEIYLNNANYELNPGYQGEANKTAIVLLRQPYNSVNTAPSDEEFEKSTTNKVAWAHAEYSDGWYTYSLKTHLMQPVLNRTYVLRLPDGKYAKLQLINIYKSNPPAVTDMNWPAPYLTFKYYVQQDGSKNLTTP